MPVISTKKVLLFIMLALLLVSCQKSTWENGMDAGDSDLTDKEAGVDEAGNSDSDTDADSDADASCDSGDPGICGDGQIKGSEECDDANDVDLDGCHECLITAILVDEGDSDRRVYGPDVALMHDGAFAVTWLSDSDEENPLDTSVYLKIFDENGFPSVSDILVTDSGSDLSTASGDSGNIIIIWSNQDQRSCSARLYNSDGQALTNEFQVNSSAEVDYADVAMAPDGSFVVVWSSYNTEYGNLALYARRYDSTGNAVNDEWRIRDPQWSWEPSAPIVRMDEEGNFTVVVNMLRDKTSTNYLMRYDADGMPVVNPAGIEFGFTSPALFVASDNAYAVAWCEPYCDGNGVRIYNESGLETGTFFNNSKRIPLHMGLNDHDEVYLFHVSRNSSNELKDFHAERYDSAGNPVGETFNYVDPCPKAFALSVGMDMMPEGHFVLAWDMGTRDENENPVDTAVYVQRFNKDGSRIGNNEWP